MVTCDQCQHSVTVFEWHTKQNLCEHLLLDVLAKTRRPFNLKVRPVVRVPVQIAV